MESGLFGRLRDATLVAHKWQKKIGAAVAPPRGGRKDEIACVLAKDLYLTVRLTERLLSAGLISPATFMAVAVMVTLVR